MHHDKSDWEPFTQVKQVVSLLASPAVVMEMLLVLKVTVDGNLRLLQPIQYNFISEILFLTFTTESNTNAEINIITYQKLPWASG